MLKYFDFVSNRVSSFYQQSLSSLLPHIGSYGKKFFRSATNFSFTQTNKGETQLNFHTDVFQYPASQAAGEILADSGIDPSTVPVIQSVYFMQPKFMWTHTLSPANTLEHKAFLWTTYKDTLARLPLILIITLVAHTCDTHYKHASKDSKVLQDLDRQLTAFLSRKFRFYIAVEISEFTLDVGTSTKPPSAEWWVKSEILVSRIAPRYVCIYED